MTAQAAVEAVVTPRPTASIRDVTPKMARMLRDTCHFGRQRNMSKVNIDFLANEMVEGRFIPGTAISFGILPDGTRFLLNGNHTLEAVAAAGATIPLTFINIPCATIDEAGRIYGRLDQQRRRTWKDQSRAAGLSATTNVNVRWHAAFGGAMTIIQTKFNLVARGRKRISDNESLNTKLNLGELYAPLLHAFIGSFPEGSIDSSNARLLQRSTVLAVALETFRGNYAKAEEFWGGLVDDNGLKKGDPRKTLLEWLRGSAGKGSAERDLQVKAAQTAWNYFMRGESVAVLKPTLVTKFVLNSTEWGKDDDDALLDGLVNEAARVVARAVSESP